MQTLEAGDTRATRIIATLQDETNDLEALHRGWARHVAAWRLAHDAAARSASGILSRIDALIAAIEPPNPGK